MSYKRIWPNFVRKGHIRWADNKMSAKNTKKKNHMIYNVCIHISRNNWIFFIS